MPPRGDVEAEVGGTEKETLGPSVCTNLGAGATPACRLLWRGSPVWEGSQVAVACSCDLGGPTWLQENWVLLGQLVPSSATTTFSELPREGSCTCQQKSPYSEDATCPKLCPSLS